MSLADTCGQLKEHHICPRACLRVWCGVLLQQWNLVFHPYVSDAHRDIVAAMSGPVRRGSA